MPGAPLSFVKRFLLAKELLRHPMPAIAQAFSLQRYFWDANPARSMVLTKLIVVQSRGCQKRQQSFELVTMPSLVSSIKCKIRDSECCQSHHWEGLRSSVQNVNAKMQNSLQSYAVRDAFARINIQDGSSTLCIICEIEQTHQTTTLDTYSVFHSVRADQDISWHITNGAPSYPAGMVSVYASLWKDGSVTRVGKSRRESLPGSVIREW